MPLSLEGCVLLESTSVPAFFRRRGEERLVLIYTQERPWSLGSRKSSYLHKVLRRGYSHLG